MFAKIKQWFRAESHQKILSMDEIAEQIFVKVFRANLYGGNMVDALVRAVEEHVITHTEQQIAIARLIWLLDSVEGAVDEYEVATYLNFPEEWMPHNRLFYEWSTRPDFAGRNSQLLTGCRDRSRWMIHYVDGTPMCVAAIGHNNEPFVIDALSRRPRQREPLNRDFVDRYGVRVVRDPLGGTWTYVYAADYISAMQLMEQERLDGEAFLERCRAFQEHVLGC